MGYVRECGIVFLDINMEGMDGLDTAGMGFVRIHQSFLINMRYIGKLSSYVMVLTTGKEISVPKSRYVVLYFASMVVALFGGCLDLIGIKTILIILVFIAFCAVFYEADWKQRIFFSVLNYSLLFLTDLFLSVGLIFINILVIELMQGILGKGELLTESISVEMVAVNTNPR